MKNLMMILAILFMTCSVAMADDKPIDVKNLPSAARKFIKTHYPSVKITYAAVDDDLFRPDYKVLLSDGTKIDFENNGDLDKVKSRSGIPASIVPAKIREYVSSNYPESIIVSYEKDRAQYEIELSNGLELEFNNTFHLTDIDD